MDDINTFTTVAPPYLNATGFARAFPFYVQLDQQLQIISLGRSMQKVTGSVKPPTFFKDFFQVMGLTKLDTYEDLLSNVDKILTLKSRTVYPVTLRGCAEVDENGKLLLLLTPVLASVGEQQNAGLSFTDFAKHDSAADALLLLHTTRTSNLDVERIARRLRHRSEQLNSILELGNHGVVFFDKEQSVLHVNSAFLGMLGLKRVDIFDMHLMELDSLIQNLSDRNAGECPSLVALREVEDAEKLHATLYLQRPRPRVIYLDCARSKDGGTVYYMRDITHESEIDRMKSEFLAAAAHELRTPMVSIVGFTELLLSRKFTEERRTDMLQTIHRQSGLLVKMINELLDLARIESRRGLDLQIRVHPLRDLIENTVKGMMLADTHRQISIGALPDTGVLIDPEKMQLALGNLLSNAFKYSPLGGTVALTARIGKLEARPFVAVEITDKGIGMSPQQRERAFERFYRADASGNIPGTGLGLSMVKEIAELHGGRVELVSEIGVGTVATFWLPVAKDSVC